jgi:hypothetical protein
MRAALSGLAVVVAVACTPAATFADDGAKKAANVFGQALVARAPSALRPILPQQGRVHLSLIRLGPEEGLFGAQQVEAVFRDFLASGSVASFELVRCESDPKRSALAHGRAAITDRQGRSVRIGIHLGFEPEGDRWVLREVKETAE